MGKIIVHNQPCNQCGSSDALQIYENLTATCFSCQTWFPANPEYKTKEFTQVEKPKKSYTIDIEKFKSVGFKERKISKEVAEFFNVRSSFNEDGEVDTHYYPYGEGIYKVRKLPKTFSCIGKPTTLFGMDKFTSGGKRLIVTEGELDAMAVAQASLDKYGKIYPVVSIPSASNVKTLLTHRDWIRGFDTVVLCLDNDEAGEKAKADAIKYVGADKVRLAKLPVKDASQMLLEKGGQQLLVAIWEASKYTPVGILGRDELWEALKAYNDIESIPYPPCLDALNAKTKGMRENEIVLFTSGTGSGKSTILREIVWHIIDTTKEMVGIVALEEAPAETTRKLAGIPLNVNPSFRELTESELEAGFRAVFGDDRIMVLDHQGSMEDSTLFEKLEYMALSGCKYLFIDHITILVSEGVDGLTGNEAIDKTMNDLLRLCKRYPVWIGLVSHLRKTPTGKTSFEEGQLPSLDDIKGSGSIKQISNDIIAFARDMSNDDDRIRNHIKMRVLKSRFTGLTGNVPGVDYDYPTGRLEASIFMQPDDFVEI
jgi:twinkle protein